MIEIDESNKRTIYIHRGDKGTIYYTIEITEEELYEFQIGNKVEFTVFEEKGYDKTPVISKIIDIKEITTEVEINLTEQDTIIGEASNKPIIYWYEISLNGNDTTNGYDYEEGAAEFILLPAKGGK